MGWGVPGCPCQGVVLRPRESRRPGNQPGFPSSATTGLSADRNPTTASVYTSRPSGSLAETPAVDAKQPSKMAQADDHPTRSGR